VEIAMGPIPIEWIKKTCYIYTMEYYSVIKKNEVVPFAGKWMELEIILLSEISQTQKRNVACCLHMLHMWIRDLK
jgi:hypothetical protein